MEKIAVPSSALPNPLTSAGAIYSGRQRAWRVRLVAHSAYLAFDYRLASSNLKPK